MGYLDENGLPVFDQSEGPTEEHRKEFQDAVAAFDAKVKETFAAIQDAKEARAIMLAWVGVGQDLVSLIAKFVPMFAPQAQPNTKEDLGNQSIKGTIAATLAQLLITPPAQRGTVLTAALSGILGGIK